MCIVQVQMSREEAQREVLRWRVEVGNGVWCGGQDEWQFY